MPHISKEIISRDFKYSSLQELITVAARYEQNILIPSLPDTGHSPTGALFSQPTVDKQGRKTGFTPSTGSSGGKPLNDGRFNSKGNRSNNNVQLCISNRSHKICSLYNKFAQSHCQLANNQCFYGRQHKCSECGKIGCKAFKHRPKQTSPQAHVISLTNTESPIESKLTQLFENLQTQMNNMFTSLSTKIEKVEAVVNALPSELQISDLNLATKHILWAPVTSAGVKLPLPLDSCCSLSLVSQIHAELVSQKCPHLSYKN